MDGAAVYNIYKNKCGNKNLSEQEDEMHKMLRPDILYLVTFNTVCLEVSLFLHHYIL